MAKVDSKGRIVLPQELRERLGLSPGTEVEVRESNGRAVVEPEDDPDRIIGRMEKLIEEATTERRPAPDEGQDVYAKDHAETIRRQARRAEHDGE